MPSNNERLYHELGEVKGMLASMDKRFNSFDKRLERMEAKQDDVLKKLPATRLSAAAFSVRQSA